MFLFIYLFLSRVIENNAVFLKQTKKCLFFLQLQNSGDICDHPWEISALNCVKCALVVYFKSYK